MPELRYIPTDQQVWIDPRTVSVAKSNTGTISFGVLQQITLTTGSPVWVKLSNELQQEFDTLSINYEFASRAEGLLSVFLDDQVVFKADERDAKAGVNSSGSISVGNITPGQHTLSLRLDRFTDAQSSVTVSGITTANTSIVRVTNQKPIANASGVPVARLRSLVQLSGQGSYDPDQKPLPLSFHWKQIGGPPVLLFGGTSLVAAELHKTP